MTALPKQYAWLDAEGAPAMIVEALKEFGTLEGAGVVDNPKILKWAKEVGITWYKHDDTPWCALFMAVIARRAKKDVPKDALRALAWQTFGNAAQNAMLGDILVFKRTGGGHVGLYVGEDASSYHVLGGNQSDRVCIKRILKERCVAVRRPVYAIGKPKNVRKIILSPTGKISTNEA